MLYNFNSEEPSTICMGLGNQTSDIKKSQNPAWIRMHAGWWLHAKVGAISETLRTCGTYCSFVWKVQLYRPVHCHSQAFYLWHERMQLAHKWKLRSESVPQVCRLLFGLHHTVPVRLSYANLIGIREMSERANDQLADLIGSECNGHMQAGIASVTPDLRHIRLFPEDWPLRIFCFPPPAPIPCFVRTLIYSWICALPWRMRRNYVIPIHTYSSHDVGFFGHMLGEGSLLWPSLDRQNYYRILR